MKFMTTSQTTFAAFGILAGASVAASACPFQKNNVTAAAPPPATQEEVVVAPATTVDPVLLADARAALVPVAPREESVEATIAD